MFDLSANDTAARGTRIVNSKLSKGELYSTETIVSDAHTVVPRTHGLAECASSGVFMDQKAAVGRSREASDGEAAVSPDLGTRLFFVRRRRWAHRSEMIR